MLIPMDRERGRAERGWFIGVSIALVISLGVNLFLAARLSDLEGLASSLDTMIPGMSFDEATGVGTIFDEGCPPTVKGNRICSISIVEKHSNWALVRIHYHYLKGQEDWNRIVVTAHSGTRDNVIGIHKSYSIAEGNNTIDIAIGFHRGKEFGEQEPYVSKYIMVDVKGVDRRHNIYLTPELMEIHVEVEQKWSGTAPDLSYLPRPTRN